MLGLLTTAGGITTPVLILLLAIAIGVFSAVWIFMRRRGGIVSNRQSQKAQLIEKWSDESPLHVLRFRTGDGRVWEYKVEPSEYDRFDVGDVGRLETDGPEYRGFVSDPKLR